MAVNQTGSRAGLVTALVIFVITTVAAGIIAGVQYSARQKVDQTRAALEKQSKLMITEAEKGQSAYRAAAAKAQPEVQTVWSNLVAQRDVLAAMIPVNIKSEEQQDIDGIRKYVTDSVQSLAKETGATTISAGNLLGSIDSLARETDQQRRQLADMQKKLNDSTGILDAKVEEYESKLKTLKAEVDKVNDSARQTTADVDKDRDARNATLTAAKEDWSKQQAALGDEINNLKVQIQTKEKDIEAMNRKVAEYRAALAIFRMDPTGAIARTPDGAIVRVVSKDRVYINRGLGDQVTPGLTFEVYDRNEGVPRVVEGLSDTALPVGKASIEVINVGQNSSECRVLPHGTGPQPQLIEGDIIANLIYDVNRKFKFAIYPGAGFDLAQTGRPDPRDAEILKGLVTKWGAKIVDIKIIEGEPPVAYVPVETDFVIMGMEPVVPDDDPNDPDRHNEYLQAIKRLESFDAVRNSAVDLHVPVLNLNRFLYLVGYFEQAKR